MENIVRAIDNLIFARINSDHLLGAKAYDTLIDLFSKATVQFVGDTGPKVQTSGSAGADVSSNEYYRLDPGEIKVVATGIRVSVPAGFELQVRARSGLACRGIMVANGIGTIDSDYRGEIKVILINMGKENFVINKGDRIGQLVLSRVYRGVWIKVSELDKTERGTAGFGSTGLSIEE